MRRIITLSTLAGALAFAAPAQAQADWNFCTDNSLSVCMNFQLTNPSGDNWELLVTYTSGAAADAGKLTAAGLYRASGADNINVSNVTVVATSTGNQASWGTTPGELGTPNLFEVAANTNGEPNGLPEGGWIRISFTSDNIGANTARLEARAHIISYGDMECSLKPDSGEPGNVIDGVAEINRRCGTTTVTPEPMTVILLGSGLAGVGAVARRRRSVIES